MHRLLPRPEIKSLAFSSGFQPPRGYTHLRPFEPLQRRFFHEMREERTVSGVLRYAFDVLASAAVSTTHDALRSSPIAASMMRWRERGPSRSSVIELNL